MNRTRAVLLALASWSQNGSAADTLNCFVGPIEMRIGVGNWQVTSCDDGRSLALASVADNPATPFVFFVLRNTGKAHITGEGSGSKEASSSAFEQLKSMTEAQLDALVEVTKLVKKAP